MSPKVKSKEHVFLKACNRKPTEYTPIWIMRQAGRYLAEYRAVRSKHKFIEMCKNPELSCEVTLQPVDLIGVDAAILFSDIMLIIDGMGVDFEFAETGGPVIKTPVRTEQQVNKLRVPDPLDSVPYVIDAVKLIKKELNGRVPLIGFSGAPFTLASYMIEGGHSRNYVHTKKMMYNRPDLWNKMMKALVEMIASYLAAQVEAGAEAIQVFDSWIGCLAPADYDDYVKPHMKRLFKALAKLKVPRIHFGTDTITLIESMRDAGGDVIGVDWKSNLDDAWKKIGYDRAVQGNLDPTVLFGSTKLIKKKAKDILDRAGGRPGHIFNLGHGILPETPPENARALVEIVHELSSKGK